MNQAILTIKKSVVKRFLATFIPIALSILILSWAIYYFQIIKTRKEILKAKEINLLALQKELIQHTIKTIISDIQIIAEEETLNMFFDSPDPKNLLQLETGFITFSRYKGIYDQIRLLDAAGMERIRVDLTGHKPVLVPADKLQFKGKRYYFNDTLKLKKGEIFMSPLDLNIERGEIEQPLKPMIRFGTPVFNWEGKKSGVLIINYLAQNLIDDLNRLSFDSPGRLMMINSDGYWLRGMKPEEEWGFMFDDRRKINIKDSYPSIWQRMQQDNQGQTSDGNGLMTYVKVFPLKEGIRASSGSPSPFSESARNLTKEEFFWVIISRVPPHEMVSQSKTLMISFIFTDLFLLALLAGLSWQLALARAKRKEAQAALKHANQELEEKIRQRTRDLMNSNHALKKEIKGHRQAQKEKKKMEFQLRQAQKMEAIGTLAGGIAHDFNNILTPIIGYAEMAGIRNDPDTPLYDDLKKILSAALRAKDLVGQILTFSRQTEKKMRPIRIHLIAKETLNLLRSTLPSTIEIKKEIQADCSPVMADLTQIQQVIMNLCTNAYHAMREKGGRLGITLEEIEIQPGQCPAGVNLDSGKYVQLEIADTGHGMTPDVREQIFNPYFTTKIKGEGTGLGLSVVHGIIKNCNGHINVHSEPGTGTTFNIYFPVIDESRVPIADVPKGEALPGGDEHILLVDDEKEILDYLARALEQMGYRVTAFYDCHQALEAVEKNPKGFDLVISDMTMPVMNGLELIKQIKAHNPDIQAIMTTGFSGINLSGTAALFGVSSYIHKPVLLSELAGTVRKVLDGKF